MTYSEVGSTDCHTTTRKATYTKKRRETSATTGKTTTINHQAFDVEACYSMREGITERTPSLVKATNLRRSSRLRVWAGTVLSGTGKIQNTTFLKTHCIVKQAR